MNSVISSELGSRSPQRHYFPIKHATTIVPIQVQTNHINIVSRTFDLWWIDGIEIPKNKTWGDLTNLCIRIGEPANVNYRIPLQPLLTIDRDRIYDNFWRFPMNKLFEMSIPIIALPYHQVSFQIEAKDLFEIKIYQGCTYLDTESRRSLAESTKEIKLRYISQPFRFNGKIINMERPINFISTGFILYANELQNLKIFMDGNLLIEYDNTMLKAYVKRYGWKYTKKHQKILHAECNKIGVPYDVIGLIENEIHKNSEDWWWIPFAPAEDPWKWDFNDLNVNMSLVDSVRIEVEPEQQNAEVYFMNYNLMMVMSGMAGMKFIA